MSLEIPGLPSGQQVPSVAQMAGLLLEAFPERDRGDARATLEDVLRKKMVGIADHPRPRRLAELAYEEVADVLRGGRPEDRLAILGGMALHSEGQELSDAALSLAVARYLKDHPERAERAGDWIDDSVRGWRSKPLDQFREEATRRLEQLENWAKRVQADDPKAWEAERLTYVPAKLALQSARSGSFGTAAGTLYDFLTAVGAPVESLDIH